MPKDKEGIPFIGHDAACEVLECAYGIKESDDDCYHERIEEKLAEKDIGLESAVDLIERLMPMIFIGKSFLTDEKYKGFAKVQMSKDGMVNHVEMIGKVTEDFWLVEDEKGQLAKGVFKKREEKTNPS